MEDIQRPKWSEIAKNLSKINKNGILRLGKHVRERYYNHLDPNLKKYQLIYK